MKESIEKRFLNDIKDHKLTVISDDGVNRSLLFKHPDNSYYYFQLTTWDNHLCISGDMGTYVFKRIHDMFSFFRMDKDDFSYNKDKVLNINHSYWHEKLVADDSRSGSMEFSKDLVRDLIREDLEDYCKDNDMSDDFKSECWDRVESELLDFESEEMTRHAIGDDWTDNEDQEGFAESLRTDFWEVNLQDYTFHFTWCLYAIVWGIRLYDEQRNNNNK